MGSFPTYQALISVPPFATDRNPVRSHAAVLWLPLRSTLPISAGASQVWTTLNFGHGLAPSRLLRRANSRSHRLISGSAISGRAARRRPRQARLPTRQDTQWEPSDGEASRLDRAC